MSHYSPVVAALVTMLLTVIILVSKFSASIEDVPNERSLHQTPTPRFGGISLMAGMLSGWALMITHLKWWVVLPLIGIFFISLLDDVHGLPVKRRLLAHFLSAAIFVLGAFLSVTFVDNMTWLLAPVALLFVVWMSNLYNFMDGSDGLAGGMALIGFSVYGVASLMNQDDVVAMMNFTIGAAALGFLYFNSSPAKVFMGDAGSISLGFLAAAMGLWGWLNNYWPLWFPLLVFSPFILDATVTLARRALRGAKVTEAHREHYYQRLILAGWSHKRLAWSEYALMLCVGISALFYLHEPYPWPLLLGWCIVYAALMAVVDAAWKKSGQRQLEQKQLGQKQNG
ncbi:MAG: glycosyltransferase family 4 protein [Gallionellaceae bacterium]|jgi:UDP-N-acetylmuramyl pentapeptide phosphotransferase/UDP-N-acetylglucosamine-1-phosphate transferase|nr:glycosyltransferase family 4 protein [Gallionellaceae bacterium]